MRFQESLSLCLTIALAACGGGTLERPATPPPPAAPAPSTAYEGAYVPEQVADRRVILRTTMDVTVEDPRAAAAQVESLVRSVSGWVDASRGGSGEVEMSLRVPAASLDQVRDGIRPLGRVERETSSAADVTGRTIDLEARLQSLAAVRDRLRGYIDRAANVEEIIQVERELTRVQAEIEQLTAELERLRTQVAMSTLDVTLDRRRTPGPLTVVGKGVAAVFTKLVYWN